jgi:predicted nucleic acid-binding protein
VSLKVFVDSDVIISSMLSSSGAAHFLLHHTDAVELYISNLSLQEIRIVVERLSIDSSKLASLLEGNIDIVQLQYTKETVKTAYGRYVLDENDAHIVAGAKEVKARFIVSYNSKDFKVDKIKQDFAILLITPAHLLQYIRSI